MDEKDFPIEVAGMPEHNERVRRLKEQQIETQRHNEIITAANKSNFIDSQANKIAKEANTKADTANDLALETNKKSTVSMIFSIIEGTMAIASFVISIIALVISCNG